MGGVYAREQGRAGGRLEGHLPPLPADWRRRPAIRRRADDLGKAAAAWAAVALADKVDTVVGLFGAGEKPTGSRDPLGIRRPGAGDAGGS